MTRPLEKRRCHVCGQRSLRRVKRAFEYEVSHDGRAPVKISVPDLDVIACTNPDCRPEHPHDTIIHDAITDAQLTEESYRQLGLLTPREIRERREALGLSQQEMQRMLGIGGNSMSRWEQGHVYQSRALDRFMRVFFANEEVRQMLDMDDWTLPNAPKEPSFDERFPNLKEREVPHLIAPPDIRFLVGRAA